MTLSRNQVVTGRNETAGFEQLLTVSEVAASLRVSKMTIYRLVHSGELRSIRVAKSLRIPVSELARFTAA